VSSAPTIQLQIDQKYWCPFQATDELGFLGSRWIGELGQDGQRKRLLIRYVNWTQPGGPQAQLTLVRFGLARLRLREATPKIYPQRVQQGGREQIVAYNFIQQDVSGLVSLRQAVQDAVRQGQPRRIWMLFHEACRALDRFCGSFAPGQPIPLQCPPASPWIVRATELFHSTPRSG